MVNEQVVLMWEPRYHMLIELNCSNPNNEFKHIILSYII